MECIKILVFVLSLQRIVENTVVCQGSNLDIACPTNSSIYISEANYGRTDRHTCAKIFGLESQCSNYKITEEILISRCENKTTCTIHVENDFFGNPCLLISKYLNVTHYCKENGGNKKHTGTEWVSCRDKGKGQTDNDDYRNIGTGVGIGFFSAVALIGFIYSIYHHLLVNRIFRHKPLNKLNTTELDVMEGKITNNERQLSWNHHNTGDTENKPTQEQKRDNSSTGKHEYESIRSSNITITYDLPNSKQRNNGDDLDHSNYNHASNRKTSNNYDVANDNKCRNATISNQYDA